MAHAAELDATVFAGYLAGLRDLEWQGDPRVVRYGFAAAVALLLGVGGVGVWIPALVDNALLQGVEQALGQPRDRIVERFAALQTYLLVLGDEARALRTSVG